MSDKEISDLSLERTECGKCGAIWINGTHYWKTGATSDSSEIDLAGLVCNPYGNDECINPMRGNTMGDTWEKRWNLAEALDREM